MTQTAIETLVTRWSQPGGIPFKGSLIDNNGCMCAQGQALHYIGGWTPEQLRNSNQSKADRETARLLGISKTHSILLRRVNDGVPGAPSSVLTDPEKHLGDQWVEVLAFWRHLDRMNGGDWKKVLAARAAAGAAAGDAARAAAGDAAWDAARAAAWAAACDAAWDAAGAAGATNEIQGAAVMRAKGQPFFFLPMFGFADPEAVLAAEVQP